VVLLTGMYLNCVGGTLNVTFVVKYLFDFLLEPCSRTAVTTKY